MKKIAIYGKGGIGKSTTVSNVAVALAKEGYTVMQIGCDPKADSTLSLRENKDRKSIKTVLDLIREKGNDFSLEDMAIRGACGVVCVEAGGPTPGVGCAGRGIIAALDKLKEKGAYEILKPDIVIYDVLGDVVCGGFSMPMRAGYADKVYIITSGENMSIYAAANIAMAVQGFKSKGYASLGGLILNHHDIEGYSDIRQGKKSEAEKAADLAADFDTQVIGELSRSETVREAEEMGKTVVEAFPDSAMAEEYRKLAGILLKM